jgi:hypothetical protein
MREINPLKYKIMSLPFNLAKVHETSSLVEGYDVIRKEFPTNNGFTYSDAVFNSLEIVANEYSDWDEDQGFGSSDMTYVRQLFIDKMLFFAGLRGYYETKFQPYLKVVEYSEAEHHNMVQKMESGI